MKNRIPLTKKEVEDYFEYINGELWRKAWVRSKSPINYRKVENKDNHKGYCRIRFKNSMVYYHVILWILLKGDIPAGLTIDHIDGNKLNNNIDNLRLVTQRQNNQNKEVHRKGKLVGCFFDKKKNKWCAQTKIGKNHIFIGNFTTELEAHQAYLNYIKQKKLI